MTESTTSAKKSLNSVEGWILDLYPKNDYMIVWLKTKDDQVIRLVDVWQQCFYVAGEYSALINLTNQLHVEDMCFEEKLVKPENDEPSPVLKVPVQSVHKAEWLAEKVLAYGRYEKYELYNVDVNPSQLYMYKKDIYPFGYVKSITTHNRIRWELHDSIKSTDYETPPLREIILDVEIRKERRLPARTDPIETITVTLWGETYCSDGHDEQQKLLWLVETLKVLDPDVIYTTNGDNFLFPYLGYRAKVNDVADQFTLGRESSPLRTFHRKGQTYMSYGRVYYRPTPTRLLGRIHIDRENSILYKDCGLSGIIEVARLCRIPAQRVSNTTIGTSMTSAQLYEAVHSDILIPWRKTNAEDLKTANELLLADRGGLCYEPKIGIHESVGELDFTSLYPMIMLKKNLSSETVRCKCCPDSKNRVPELGYNICEKHVGIVPRSLRLLLDKRQQYKELKQTTADPELRRIYEMRQAALKWILVCAFGYLGFRNARFGRIDAHIATCAFARQILRDTVHLAESRGFRLIHGIVDSLWLKKEGATAEEDYLGLRNEIEKTTELPISFEGIYRWIVFLPSKTRRNVPVLSRYYGVFRSGKIKDRGIATRRHDTPPIIDRCIREILYVLAESENVEELYEKLPTVYRIVNRYIHALRSGTVPLEELVIQKHLSQNLDKYKHKVLQAVVADQLAMEDAVPNAGEFVRYVITNGQSKLPSRRALALELCENHRLYDIEAYVELLLSSLETILGPFGPNRTNPSKPLKAKVSYPIARSLSLSP